MPKFEKKKKPVEKPEVEKPGVKVPEPVNGEKKPKKTAVPIGSKSKSENGGKKPAEKSTVKPAGEKGMIDSFADWWSND